MKIPKNMTEEQVVSTIYRISSRLATKYTFPNYEADDIAQEAFIIGMEAMNRYDEVRPLENFLSIHIKNRLKNFKRDNYFRPDEGKAEKIQQGKKKLLDASSIDEVRNFLVYSEASENIEERELVEYIDQHLPANMRSDYLRFMNDQPLTKTKKTNLISELQSIVERFYA
jgi:DNA-directed RNA polymerase specialized sigma24 family protein